MWSHMARIIGEVRPRFVFVENSPALVTRGLGVVLGDMAALGYDCRWTVLGAADVGAPHQRDRLWIVAHTLRDGCVESADKRAGACDGGRVAEAHWQVGQTFADAIEPGREDVADSNGMREPQPQGCECHQRGRACDCGSDMAHADSQGLQNRERWGEVAELTLERAADYTSCDSGGKDGWGIEPGICRMVDGVAHRTHRLKAIGNGQVPQCAAAAWRMLGGP